MSRRPPTILAGAAMAAALVLAAAGCGRKALPLPPQIRVADPTRDLVVAQDNRNAVLEWSYPSLTTAGGPLPDVETVEVWRATVPAAGEPQGSSSRDRQIQVQLLQANGEVIAELDSDGLAAATRGPKLRLEDRLDHWWEGRDPEAADSVLWYAVRTVCCNGRRSAFSNIARLRPEEPPPPPAWVAVRGTEEGIELQWAAAEELLTLVERSEDGDQWQSLTVEPMTETELLDGSAAQGRTWRYRLRSVRATQGNARVVGEPGEVRVVEHPDLYPPAAPLDLVCLPEDERVRLRWQAPAKNLRYTISRALDGRRPEVVEEAWPGTEYEDLEPPYGRLTYSVQALDRAANLSPPTTCETVVGAEP